MRLTAIALIVIALAGIHGAELLNADFEDLKRRLVGTWSFTENGQSYDATFEVVAHGHAILERNSGFIAVYYPEDVYSLLMTLYTREGNQPRLRAKGFGQNPAPLQCRPLCSTVPETYEANSFSACSDPDSC